MNERRLTSYRLGGSTGKLVGLVQCWPFNGLAEYLNEMTMDEELSAN